MRYIAIKTSSSHYKFINVTEVKEQISNVATVVTLFAVVYLILCL